jgi:hypothetical protein
MSGLELEITPEPSPEERAAIELALAGRLTDEAGAASAWWRAGALEAVEDEYPAEP